MISGWLGVELVYVRFDGKIEKLIWIRVNCWGKLVTSGFEVG